MKNLIMILFLTILYLIGYFDGYLFGYENGSYKFNDSLCEYNSLSSLRIGTKSYCTDGNKIIDLKLIK